MMLQPFADEQLNFFKFSSIVLDEFPKALRQTFTQMWDNTFAHLPGYQAWDDSIAVQHMFLAKEGSKTKVPTHLPIKDWDCTALFQATIYARSFALPDSKGHLRTLNELYVRPKKIPYGTFHPCVISPSGNTAESYALAIDQLRLLRNTLCHSPFSQIDKKTFDNYVQLTKESLTALGVNTSSIDAIGSLNETNFPTLRVQQLQEDIKKEILKIYTFLEQEVKDELQGMRSDIAQMNQERQQELKEVASGLKDELCAARSAISRSNQNQQAEKMMTRTASEMMDKVREVQAEIARSTDVQMETNDAVKEMKKQLNELKPKVDKAESDLFTEPKNNTPESQRSLPKPSLPPMVPHFIGRKNECDEVIGHLTSEATRLVTICGPPGFGKTSVAIAVGYNLQAQELPVYFLSLRGLKSKEDLVSKLLSLLQQSTPLSAKDQSHVCSSPADELYHLLSKMKERFFLILDNADDLLESGAPNVKEEVTDFVGEILMHCPSVTFLCTTRESLEFMDLQIQAHRAVRITELDLLSSANLVDKLLPRASFVDCLRITQMCGQVPLAMKLLCSSMSEDSVPPSQFLSELSTSTENIIEMLDNPDYPSHLRLRSLFDSSFRRLSRQEQEAFVSLSVFPGNFDVNAAAAVMGKTSISVARKILRRLQRRSLIDSSPRADSFLMHPLVQSFASEKGEDEMEEIASLSKTRFCTHFVSLFNELNTQFLTGYSFSALLKFADDKDNIAQGLVQGCSDCDMCGMVFSALVKAEVFLDSCWDVTFVDTIYHLAVAKAKELQKIEAYFQLVVAKTFIELQKGSEEETIQLLLEAKEIRDSSSCVPQGARGKSLCYHGIFLLLTGKTEDGVRHIEDSIRHLNSNTDNTFLKVLSFQILALYYKSKNDLDMSSTHFKRAFKACKTAGDLRLLILAEDNAVKTNTEEVKDVQGCALPNQPLVLEVILLVCNATRDFSCIKSTHKAVMVVQDLQREVNALFSSGGIELLTLFQVLFGTLTNFSRWEEAVQNHLKRIQLPQINTSAIDHTNENEGEDGLALDLELAQCCSDLGCLQCDKSNYPSALQLHQCALYIRLRLLGKDHKDTAESFYRLGIVQAKLKDYSSALQSQHAALEIRLKQLGDENAETAEIYDFLGAIQSDMGSYTLAHQSFQCALDIRLQLFGEHHTSTANNYESLGDTQLDMKDYAAALQSHQRALHIRLKLFGEEHSSTADSYKSLGGTQYNMENYPAALQSFQSALDIRLKLFGEQHPLTAISYEWQGLTHFKLGDYATALQSFQSSLDIRLKLFWEQYPSTTDSYSWLGMAQLNMKDHTAALQSHQRALDIRLKLFGEHHSSTADSYESLGNTQLDMKDYAAALQSHQRGLNVKLKLFGEQHLSTADSYKSLGDTQLNMNDFAAALQSHQRGLNAKLKLFGEQHSSTADSYRSLGGTQYNMKNYSAALQSFQRALGIRLKLFGEHHPSTADNFHWLGKTQLKLEDYAAALQSHQRALHIRLNLFGKQHPSTAESYESLGNTQFNMNNYAESLESHQCALDIRINVLGEEHLSTANSHLLLGGTQLFIHNYATALQSFKRAIDIRLKLFGEHHSSTANIYKSLGSIQLYMKDYAAALQSHQQALHIRLKLFGEQDKSTADSYKSLGDTQFDMKDFAAALQSHQRALSIRLKLFGEQHSSTAESYKSLGYTNFNMKDYAAALQSFQSSLNVKLKLFGEQHSSTADSYELLGLVHSQMEDCSTALQSHQRALDIRIELFGEQHPSTAQSYQLRGFAQFTMGNYAAALQSFQCSLGIRLKLFGEQHSSTVESYTSLRIAQYQMNEEVP